VRTQAIDVFGRDTLHEPTIGVLDVQHGDAACVQVEQDVGDDARLACDVGVDDG